MKVRLRGPRTPEHIGLMRKILGRSLPQVYPAPFKFPTSYGLKACFFAVSLLLLSVIFSYALMFRLGYERQK